MVASGVHRLKSETLNTRRSFDTNSLETRLYECGAIQYLLIHFYLGGSL